MPSQDLLPRDRRNPLPHFVRAGAVAALLAFSAGVPVRAAVPPSCKPVLEAMAKQRAMPSHMYQTESAAFRGNKTTTGESIYVGGAIYVKTHDVWHRSPMSVADMAKQQAENEQNAQGVTCRYLRDETVNGEAAAVYAEHSTTDGDISDVTTWISKSRTLPLKLEMDIDVGGTAGKSHRSIRYEYGNVQPPAGVK
jgi:hypothetical protein